MQDLEIEKVLTLSTAHMPNSNPDFGRLRSQEHKYGFIVFLMIDEDRAERWLEPIVSLAIQNECQYINFDCDAEIISILKTYEW